MSATATKPVAKRVTGTKKAVVLTVTRVHLTDGKTALKAYVDLCIAGMYTVQGCRVVEGSKGLFASMPRKQGNDKKWYDTVRPMSKEARELASAVIVKGYQDALALAKK